jgi:hypothetical protein
MDMHRRAMESLGEVDETTARDEPEWTTPNRVVVDLAALRLRDFSVAQEGPHPALVVAPFALHDAALADLAPGHSLVETLLVDGCSRLFLAEWKSATTETRLHTIDTQLAALNVAVDDTGPPATDAERRAEATFTRWDRRTLDLPEPYYRQVVDWFYCENRLAVGTSPALGRQINLRNLHCPLFLLAGAPAPGVRRSVAHRRVRERHRNGASRLRASRAVHGPTHAHRGVASHQAMAYTVARRRGMTVERENGIVADAPHPSPRRLNDPSMICGYARISTSGQYKRIGSQADPRGILPCRHPMQNLSIQSN